jgi:Zn finger protein HypA/HybF involved in hydrogenase expression
MLETQVNLTPKYLKPANKTKTRLWCNECEHSFLKHLAPNTLEVECPTCGSFDTEPQ